MLFRHQFATRGRQPVGRTELLDLERCLLRIFAQFVETALQPYRGALGGVEIGVEMIGQIGVGIGARDRAGQLGIRRGEGEINDEAAADAFGVDPVLRMPMARPILASCIEPGSSSERDEKKPATLLIVAFSALSGERGGSRKASLS